MPNRRLIRPLVAALITLSAILVACSTESDSPVNPTSACPSRTDSVTSERAPACPTALIDGTATPTINISRAIVLTPGDDLQVAVDSQPAGTAFEITAGLYRLQSIRPKDGDIFVGEPGAILSGARLVTTFTRDGEFWVADAELDDRGLVHGECVADYDGCSYPQDLFIDDVMLWQVTDLAELGPGEWYLDYDANRLYVSDDPSNRKVELSVVESAFYGTASNVTIRGLVIEKYATPAQWGAIQARETSDGALGDGWLVEGNEIRLNHGGGIRLGARMQVLNNYIHHNGQIGISGGGSAGILIEGNEIAYNNIAGFSWGWEAGGTKFVNTTDLVIRANHVHHNKGPGLWTDFANVNTLYEDNVVEDNENMGIYHEISYDAIIRGNSVSGNGFAFDEWLWGAGILVAASGNVEIYGNTVSDNADGIAAVQQDRGVGDNGPFEVTNLYVHDNMISMTTGESGLAQDIGDDSYFLSRGNRFENNTYHLATSGKYYAWLNHSRTIEEWVGYGNDANGRWLD